jgi:putative flippase GtrA
VSESWRRTLRRWLQYNLVGLIGIGVQLGMLEALTRLAHVPYLAATVLGVEAAVLHNFLWHERYTWSDRASVGLGQALARLARFNFTTGAISILGNVAMMRLLVGVAHLPYLPSNLLAICACGLVNFLVTDQYVFRVLPDHSPGN